MIHVRHERIPNKEIAFDTGPSVNYSLHTIHYVYNPEYDWTPTCKDSLDFVRHNAILTIVPDIPASSTNAQNLINFIQRKAST